jgi:aspartyl-tRNA(Asn)/glutamyl-tRNA(Gln) amidotransferase subunit A
VSPAAAPDEASLAQATVRELNQKLDRREVSSVELTKLALARLSTVGARLNAVATLMEESALLEAKQADDERASGKVRGPLHGIPYGAKDLLDTKGVRTTWGSGLYKDRVPDRDAAVVTRLREAGAILVAKLAMVELAGGTGYRYASASLQGPGKNPWDETRWTGGSSSGSGAAVGSGCLPFAIGSETWGSIVCPASYCGISGLRPGYGRVSRFGAMNLCFTLDKLGPLARSASDLELIYPAIAGSDPRDPSTTIESERFEPGPETLEIGVLPDEAWKGWQPEVVAAAKQALALLEKKGHRLVPVKLPDYPFDSLMLTILASEAAAAFEGLVRSGRHLELIDPLARVGLLSYMTVPAVDYVNAMRRRAMAAREMAALFDEVDVIAGPGMPSVASPLDANLETWYAVPDPLGASGNLLGLPAVCVPSGFAGGLPLGMVVLGPSGGTALALTAAKAFQAETEHHRKVPPG